MGFEFNGLIWHSEKYRERNYHAQKTQDATAVGIQLIHIWEDDWEFRKDIVKSMVASKLGCNQQPIIGARDCFVDKDVPRNEASTFLNTHHIQGAPGSATLYYGLRDNTGALTAVMTVLRQGSTFTLNRYATARRVPGGFTRLLKYLKEHVIQFNGTIVTFSDNCTSDGSLYAHTGFTCDKLLPPDYMYLRKKQRYHKFGFRKDRFRRDPSLRYVEGMTERELAELNSLYRIWDAGKVRWTLDTSRE